MKYGIILWDNSYNSGKIFAWQKKIFRLMTGAQLRTSCISLRGVFKKRPNFLNSAPTSIESALRLLSAPSVMFWQQTAICPVSLWALVVELHPLNWARAQAVRRISDKAIMKELEEQRVCVCVCVCACVWNFAANLVKILQRHLNCLTKHTGRTVWAERSAMSGLPESPLWFENDVLSKWF
jgi:hypothetical protein